MGWKNVKAAYRIEHAVCVTEEGLCIGSPYIHNIIVVGKDGKLTKRYDWNSNEDLMRYQGEMEADPQRLVQLMQSSDMFETSVPVFTYDGGTIIEKRCETPGWPNVTNDGEMMYENTFSTDKSKVVKWAKENALAGIEMFERRIKEMHNDLEKVERLLIATRNEYAKLEADYPDLPASA